jgi:hypothetical protein
MVAKSMKQAILEHKTSGNIFTESHSDASFENNHENILQYLATLLIIVSCICGK